MRRRKKKLTPNQANLLGKTLGQLQTEHILKDDIENLTFEIKRIEHLRQCERCMIEAVLGIERYMGRRLPWYLNLVNDVADGSNNCPRVQDYEIGYYGNDMLPGTTKFIKARLIWAEKVIADELNDREENLNKLSNLRRW